MNWTLPVSVKGIIFDNDQKVLLLKNERNQWELPGGRVGKNEQPEHTVFRKIKEEIGIAVKIREIIDSWVYEVIQDRYVLIVNDKNIYQRIYTCLKLRFAIELKFIWFLADG